MGCAFLHNWRVLTDVTTILAYDDGKKLCKSIAKHRGNSAGKPAEFAQTEKTVMSTQTIGQGPAFRTGAGASGGLVRQVLVLLAFIATVIVNGLANALPLNGQATGEISDRFEVFFVPAGYVFSIWSLIYLGLAAYAVYQLLPKQRNNPLLRAIAPLFLLSSVANGAWIFLWHYEWFTVTLAVMVLLLVTLIAIYTRLLQHAGHFTTAERWAVAAPFRIYLGWISVATVANATSVLDYLNWSGWGISPAWWAVILLVVAAGLGVVFSLRLGDQLYSGVIVWALVGIAVKHWATPLVGLSALTLAGVVAAAMIVGLVRGIRFGHTPAGGQSTPA